MCHLIVLFVCLFIAQLRQAISARIIVEIRHVKSDLKQASGYEQFEIEKFNILNVDTFDAIYSVPYTFKQCAIFSNHESSYRQLRHSIVYGRQVATCGGSV